MISGARKISKHSLPLHRTIRTQQQFCSEIISHTPLLSLNPGTNAIHTESQTGIEKMHAAKDSAATNQFALSSYQSAASLESLS